MLVNGKKEQKAEHLNLNGACMGMLKTTSTINNIYTM